MKNKEDIPPDNDPKNQVDSEPPMDDYGIDHDRIVEICEKMIEKIHTKYVIDDREPASTSEYRDVAETLNTIWKLTKSILNLDDVIYSAMEAMSEGPENNNSDEEENEENEGEDNGKTN